MINMLKQWWQKMPVKDRSVYLALSMAVTLLLIYVFIWEPSQRARARLEFAIQQQKTQLAKMEQQIDKLNVLKNAIQLSHSNEQGLRKAIEASANAYRIHDKISDMQTNSAGQVRVTLPVVDFDHWIRWIAALQNEQHVRILMCQIDRLDDGVKVEATLIAE